MFYVWQIIGILIPVVPAIFLCYLFDPDMLKDIWNIISAEQIMCVTGIIIIAMFWPHDPPGSGPCGF